MNIIFLAIILVGITIFVFGCIWQENIYYKLNNGQQKCDLASDCRYCFEETTKAMEVTKGCQRKICPAFMQSFGIALVIIAFFISLIVWLDLGCFF